ncbi:hypothetical protein ACT7DG_09345 [Bacillus cereus]
MIRLQVKFKKYPQRQKRCLVGTEEVNASLSLVSETATDVKKGDASNSKFNSITGRIN